MSYMIFNGISKEKLTEIFDTRIGTGLNRHFTIQAAKMDHDSKKMNSFLDESTNNFLIDLLRPPK